MMDTSKQVHLSRAIEHLDRAMSALGEARSHVAQAAAITRDHHRRYEDTDSILQGIGSWRRELRDELNQIKRGTSG